MVIYDLLGREVTTLINETMKSGYYSTRWNGRNQYGEPVSAGIYFYYLQTGAYSKAQKMLLVK
jgi:flagellar hook assembly protein FlgD